MGRNSVIRELPDEVRLDIEAQLARGVSKASICRQYGVYGINKDILLYYERNELSGRLASAWRKKSENNVVQVLDEMDDLLDTSKAILQNAIEKGHNSLAVKTIAQIRGNLELIGRIQFALHEQQKQTTVVEVREKDTQFHEQFVKALKQLPKEDQQEYRRIIIDALSLMGSTYEDEPEEEDPEPQMRRTKF